MSPPPTTFERLARPAKISDATRDLHIAAIRTELLSEPHLAPDSGLSRRRRLVAAVAAFVLTFGPGAAAVAAEGTAPGDFLYPVKRVTETIRSAWDGDIRAQHRVEEAELLIARGSDNAAVDSAIADAESALADVERPDLERRLTRARQGSTGPTYGGPGTTTGTTTPPTTQGGNGPGHGTSPGTTTGTTTPPTTQGGGAGSGSGSGSGMGAGGDAPGTGQNSGAGAGPDHGDGSGGRGSTGQG